MRSVGVIWFSLVGGEMLQKGSLVVKFLFRQKGERGRCERRFCSSGPYHLYLGNVSIYVQEGGERASICSCPCTLFHGPSCIGLGTSLFEPWVLEKEEDFAAWYICIGQTFGTFWSWHLVLNWTDIRELLTPCLWKKHMPPTHTRFSLAAELLLLLQFQSFTK